MKRFLVLQVIDFEDNEELAEEIVYDADTEAEAEAWIAGNDNPDDFFVEDSHAFDSEEEDDFLDVDGDMLHPLDPFDRDDQEVEYPEMDDDRYDSILH